MEELVAIIERGAKAKPANCDADTKSRACDSGSGSNPRGREERAGCQSEPDEETFKPRAHPQTADNCTLRLAERRGDY